MRHIRKLLRPAVIVGMLVGLAVGVAAGLGLQRAFDPGFQAAFVGALVGGALAVVGGYLGSKELIDRDDRRERQDLIGAVQVVRVEISTNAAFIHYSRQKQFLDFAELQLYDADYRQVITTLARGLPMDLFADVSVAANRTRAVGEALEREKRAGGGISDETITELTGLLDDLNGVNGKLFAYAKDVLKVEVPTLTKNPAG